MKMKMASKCKWFPLKLICTCKCELHENEEKKIFEAQKTVLKSCFATPIKNNCKFVAVG